MLAAVFAVLVAASGAGAAERPAPQRIASLNLAADEVLVEILPTDRLVAVTAQLDEEGMSNARGRVPASVTRFFRADLERLLVLRPDLVVVSEYTDPDFLRQLERSGVPHHRMQGLRTLDGYRRAILELGRAAGAEAGAQRLVARYDAALGDLARRLSGAARPRVLYWASGMTAGADSAIGALVECGGGRNVGAEIGLTGITPIAGERAFAADPDVVLVGVWPGVVDALRADPLLSRLRAVREGRVVEMPTELLVTVSHHAAGACRDLAARLHPSRLPR